jgi:hypothetical protein
MDHLNNLQKKIPPHLLPYVEKAKEYSLSAGQHIAASAKCLLMLAMSHKEINFNATEYITKYSNLITSEVTCGYNQRLFSSGVWVSTLFVLYCLYLLSYLVFGLFFVLLFPTLSWLGLWCIVMFVKEKVMGNNRNPSLNFVAASVSNVATSNEMSSSDPDTVPPLTMDLHEKLKDE